MKYKKEALLFTLVAASVATFCADMALPMGYSIWVFYVPIIFISVLVNSRKTTFFLCVFSCALISLAFILPILGISGHHETAGWQLCLFNRTIGITAILMLTFISISYLKSKERIFRLEKLICVCAWTRQIKIDGKWMSIEKFISDYLDKQVTHGISPEAYEKMIKEAEISAGDTPENVKIQS